MKKECTHSTSKNMNRFCPICNYRLARYRWMLREMMGERRMVKHNHYRPINNIRRFMIGKHLYMLKNGKIIETSCESVMQSKHIVNDEIDNNFFRGFIDNAFNTIGKELYNNTSLKNFEKINFMRVLWATITFNPKVVRDMNRDLNFMDESYHSAGVRNAENWEIELIHSKDGFILPEIPYTIAKGYSSRMMHIIYEGMKFELMIIEDGTEFLVPFSNNYCIKYKYSSSANNNPMAFTSYANRNDTISINRILFNKDSRFAVGNKQSLNLINN